MGMGPVMNRPDEIPFGFDGKRLLARHGETVAEALYRNGIRTITRSLKFHRPRGLHCGNGDCPNCLANVNGIPNVRTCITQVEAGMVVRSQNRVISLRLDPMALLDHIYRRGLNYHHSFIRPTFLRDVYHRAIRRMTGIGELSQREIASKPTRRISSDVLIIGQDPSAYIIAAACAEKGMQTLLVSDHRLLRGAWIYRSGESCESTSSEIVRDIASVRERLRDHPHLHEIAHARTLGAFEDSGVAFMASDRIWTAKPRIVILAEGAREIPVRFANWDLPGILHETAARELMRAGIRLGERVVVTGISPRSNEIARMIVTGEMAHRAILLGAHSSSEVDEDRLLLLPEDWQLLRAIGRNRVRRIVITNGGSERKIATDCVVTCGRLIPRTDIARQLGCLISHGTDGIPRVHVDEGGGTSVRGVFAIGPCTGELDYVASKRAAVNIAEKMLDSLAEVESR